MSLRTRLCDLFDIEHPILNAPMGGGDAPGALAAAVSGAGGSGSSVARRSVASTGWSNRSESRARAH